LSHKEIPKCLLSILIQQGEEHNMLIKCVKILSLFDKIDRGLKTDYLTVGKEYIVLVVYFEKNTLSFQIEDDRGSLTIFEANQFEIISNYIPTNWEVNFDIYSNGSYYFDLSPKAWNNYYKKYEEYPNYFYDKIIEVDTPFEDWRGHPGMPEVVEIYFQEKDIIYNEEEKYCLMK